MFTPVFLLSLLASACVRALPTELSSSLQRRATTLTYCPTSKTRNWQCGEACNALPGFQPSLVGGDGKAVQRYFVGSWPRGNTIVVGHQGTNPSQLQSNLTDIDTILGGLDTTLFPGASSGIKVHQGFRNQHALTAPAIFSEVQRLLANTGTNSITTVGHSLGGAISLLEGLSLRLRLPLSIAISIHTFGCPRVGNPQFVSFFDSQTLNLQRVNNKQDLIPVLPWRFWGFAYPGGEIHILGANNVVACAGDDNATDPQCTVHSVPNIFHGNSADHVGPYQGVSIGSNFCT